MNVDTYNAMETVKNGRGEQGQFVQLKEDGNWYAEIEGLQNTAQYAIYSGEVTEDKYDAYIREIAECWVSEFDCPFNSYNQSDRLWAEVAESESGKVYDDFNALLELEVDNILSSLNN